jgi:hypothetical protein
MPAPADGFFFPSEVGLLHAISFPAAWPPEALFPPAETERDSDQKPRQAQQERGENRRVAGLTCDKSILAEEKRVRRVREPAPGLRNVVHRQKETRSHRCALSEIIRGIVWSGTNTRYQR